MENQDNRELVQVLIENPNPQARSRAHVELARRARSTGDDVKALRHYREALLLDPSDAAAAAGARELDGVVDASAGKRPGLLGRVWRKVSG